MSFSSLLVSMNEVQLFCLLRLWMCPKAMRWKKMECENIQHAVEQSTAYNILSIWVVRCGMRTHIIAAFRGISWSSSHYNFSLLQFISVQPCCHKLSFLCCYRLTERKQPEKRGLMELWSFWWIISGNEIGTYRGLTKISPATLWRL